MSVRIILVDDRDAIRQAQRYVLETESDFEIVGEACNGREAIKLVEQLRPDVVIMDINMPEINGIEATRIIHQFYPYVKVISYSSHSETAYVLDMFRAGASGYVLKLSRANELSEAIRVVLKDQVYMSPSIHGILIEEIRSIDKKKSSMQLTKRAIE